MRVFVHSLFLPGKIEFLSLLSYDIFRILSSWRKIFYRNPVEYPCIITQPHRFVEPYFLYNLLKYREILLTKGIEICYNE